MATEQENLVLNVTLVDNASAGLDKLNQQLKQLGGEQHASAQNKLRTNFAGVQNSIKPLVGDFSRLSASMGNVTKSAMSMIPALSGVGTAVLGVGGILMAALIPIKKFASEMTDLGQLARETGHNAATIKMFREEFGKLFGSQGIALADQTLRGLQRSMTDILNPASKLRQELEQGARHTPEMRENMDKLINKLKEAAQKGDTTEFFNLFEEGMDNIRKNISEMPNKGPVVAAQWVNDLNKLAGIPEAVAATHVKLKGPTQEAIRNTQALIEQSTQLTRSFNSMSVSVGKISESISSIVLGFGPIVKGAQLLADAMERIANAADRWARARTGNLTPEEKAAQDKATDDIFRNAPQYPGRGAAPTTPQKSGATGAPAANDNVKVIEEENKRVTELTAEIKRLTDLLMVPTDKPQGQGFHNSPLGGALGESNPIQLPPSEKQPGGGAAAEARQMYMPRAMKEALTYLEKNESKHAAELKEYLRTGGRGLSGDANAWCARFVDAIQTRAGNPSLESSLPQGQRSGQKDDRTWSSLAYKDWGRGVGVDEDIVEGDVFVKQRKGGGHVGVATGNYRINAKGVKEYEMLSGNIGGPKKGGGEVNLTYETIGGRGAGTTAGAGHGGVVAVRRGGETIRDEGPDEGRGKGLRLDSDNLMVAQNLHKLGDSFGDDLPGMSFSQRAKYRRMQGRYLPNSPMSMNIDDRRRLDLTGDPGGLEGTGPDPQGDAEFEEELKHMGTLPRTRRGKNLNPLGAQLGLEDLNRKLLDSTMGGEISSHKVEGSADIDINVKRSGKANDKVSSLFKMPKMERQSSGTPASQGPPEDISGGANSGIYT